MELSPIPFSTPKAQVIPTVGARKGERVAVLLNANARNVTEAITKEIGRFVPAEDLYLSKSFDDARQIVNRVLDEGYTTLLTGGGDGTFVGFVNEVLTTIDSESDVIVTRGGAARQLAPKRRLPKFGVLRLGTGNSLAGLTGAGASKVAIVEDIIRARSGDVRATRTLHLIDVNGKRAPFSGMGIDAKVLNDYVAVKSRFNTTPFAKAASGGLGYFMAVTGMSIPSLFMQREPPTVTVTNEGAPAQQIGPDGKPIGKSVGTGEVIYQGKCRLAAAGTVPAYGYNFTLFPHALRAPGRMQLRLTAMTVPQILRHLPAIWKGHTPCASILDFHAEKVRIKFDRPMPLQIGGDAEGYRDQVVFTVDQQPVELLDFKATV